MILLFALWNSTAVLTPGALNKTREETTELKIKETNQAFLFYLKTQNKAYIF